MHISAFRPQNFKENLFNVWKKSVPGKGRAEVAVERGKLTFDWNFPGSNKLHNILKIVMISC